MIDQTRPNLFHYATSELSQDAFICWLAAWADPKYKDDDNHALHQAGTNFIRSIIAKGPDCDIATIKAVKVSRQVGKLDVLIEINKPYPDGEAAGELAILIEDKTHTFDHGTQLTDYYDHVVGMGYTKDKMIPLYFKTGYQSRFDTLGVFNTYLRKDFLNVLRDGQKAGIDNAIFSDFLRHLENMEIAIQQFRTKAPVDWQDNDWRGFFLKLYPYKEPYGANWGAVHNRSGGFIGFWWDEKFNSDRTCKAYLQLESFYRRPNDICAPYALCFKIAVTDKSNADAAWRDAYEKLWQANQAFNAPIEKARRTRDAWTMTIARWTGDYRLFNNGTLDMTATLENLKKAQMLLDAAFGF